MRISDWSSDVCSSDLLTPDQGKAFQVWAVERNSGTTRPLLQVTGAEALRQSLGEDGWDLIKSSEFLNVTLEDAGAAPTAPTGPVLFQGPCINLKGPAGRSEEHTSELQSLMRISYAVFCLKKKNTHTT